MQLTRLWNRAEVFIGKVSQGQEEPQQNEVNTIHHHSPPLTSLCYRKQRAKKGIRQIGGKCN